MAEPSGSEDPAATMAEWMQHCCLALPLATLGRGFGDNVSHAPQISSWRQVIKTNVTGK